MGREGNEERGRKGMGEEERGKEGKRDEQNGKGKG